MSNKEVHELAQSILKHKELYYQGTPEIDDQAYDQLEEKLKQLAPDHPVLSVVGHLKVSNKIRHQKKMLSLEKTYSIDSLHKWISDREIISMLKIDGSSCSLVYEQGYLKIAKTRGDGQFGEDISKKVLLMESVPKKISNTHDIEIRGEIFCSNENFIKITEEMKKQKLDIPNAQRNIVAGMLSRKENFHLAQFLEFAAFDLIEDKSNYKKETEKLKQLKKWDFTLPYHKLVKNKSQVEKEIQYCRNFMGSGNYLIDGIVFTYNDLNLHSELGETAHHPKYKMAFKFQGDTKETKIKNIKWNVSRFGVLTPVAEVEPVELSQAVISNVTLHNYGIVKAHQLKIGDVIEIVRSGEVIPKFLRVVKPSKNKLEFPKKCPSCNENVKEDSIRLLCTNEKCPDQVREQILYFISTIGIEDLSIKRIEEMLKKGLFQSIPELFLIKEDDFFILDKVKEKLANKLYKNIQTVKNIDLISFIASLGLIGGGKNTVEKIVKAGFNSLDKIQKMTIEQLQGIDGFAEKSSHDFVTTLKSKERLINELLKVGFIVKEMNVESKANTSNYSFCITGSLSMKRSEIERLIKDKGFKVVSSVSKNTDYLVTNDTESSSSKFKKAKQLDVPIINEEKLKKLLN
jgi:DNA ligase (NAD+)